MRVNPIELAETLDEERLDVFQGHLRDWGDRHRRSFFWRHRDLNLYESLVVEVLLARTRAQSVASIARDFLNRYPDPWALSDASRKPLEDLLRPLGLYRKRTQAFLETGRRLVEKHGGRVPADLESLMSLPYVGRYTGNAILCFSLRERRPLVDANIARVLQRFFGLRPPKDKIENDDQYWKLAWCLVPDGWPRRFYWTLIDYGSAICRTDRPLCDECLLAAYCEDGPEEHVG